jgi:hypothetical protein
MGRQTLVVMAALAVLVLSLSMSVGRASAATEGLSYQQGPVLHSSAPYLVFWVPSGESIPPGSEALMERYLADVAADSGKSRNFFGVLRQYYDKAGFADYRQTFNPMRQVIVDTHPYPPHDPGCSDVSSNYPTCITDPQIQSEVQRLITADHLPTAGSANATELSANAPIYNVVLPADVDVCHGLPTLCTGHQDCGYHWSFDAGVNVVLYAVLPLQSLRDGSLLFPAPKVVCQLDNTTTIQALDGDVNADLLITGLGHEESEAITDPIGNSGWFDPQKGNEIGDKCEMLTTATLSNGFGNNPNAFMPTLGGSEAAGTLYTQLINGHPYYMQSEWSNGDSNCEMRPTAGRIVARFSVPRGRSAAGTALAFNPAASASANPYSSATWNFGDGSALAFYSGRATLTHARHRYTKPGHYLVTLTLVDDRGNLQSTTLRLTVGARGA